MREGIPGPLALSHAGRETFTPDYAAQGLPFDDCGLCLCEEFELLFRAD